MFNAKSYSSLGKVKPVAGEVLEMFQHIIRFKNKPRLIKQCTELLHWEMKLPELKTYNHEFREFVIPEWFSWASIGSKGVFVIM